MKVIRFNLLHETEKDVEFTGGHSLRGVVASDGMGFGVCKTYVPVGGPHKWHYPNHLEACYCIKGRGVLTCLKTGVEHVITPDVMYVLDGNEEHTFEALQDTVMISIFNPPLKGDETHDKNGQYNG